MMKKLISLVLAFVLCISLVPASAFAADEVPEETAIEEPSIEEVEMEDSIVEDEETEVVEQEEPDEVGEIPEEVAPTEETEEPEKSASVEDTQSKTEVATALEENGDECAICECHCDPDTDGVASGIGTKVLTGGKRDFKWPVPGNYGLSSCFEDGRNHDAIDIAASTGTNVVASYDGTVVAAVDGGTSYYGDGFGNYVVLQHQYTLSTGNVVTLYTRYSHLNSVSVSIGQAVTGGSTVVGKVGNTGESQGSHLDFQILNGGWNPYHTYSIDPYANELLELPNGIYCASTSSCCGVGPTGCCCYYYLQDVKNIYATAQDNAPTACLDVAEGGIGTIHLRGWAFDKDITSKQVAIHVYSNDTIIYDGVANTYRDDVNDVYSCGNYHGFDFTFNTTLSGDVPITVYVLNYNQDGNYDDTKNIALCSDKIVTVKKGITVNYYGSDGSIWKTETSNANKFTLSAEYPEKSGSYFCGWTYTSGGTTIDVRPGDTITVSANVNLYPIFVTHEEAISGKTVPIYNLSDFTDTGYTVTAADYKQITSTTSGYWTDWSGWSTDAVSASDTVQVETTTLYGYYYFKCANCGTHSHGWGSGACYSWIGGCGSYISSDSAATMYSTVNWNTTQDWYGTGKYYTTIDGVRWFKWEDGGTKTGYRYKTYVQTTDEKEITFSGCVITENKTYTVTYDAAGGTGAPEAQIKNNGVDLKLSEVEPTWGGFTFLGWDTNEYEDVLEPTVKYNPGDTYTDNADVTLYAVWSDGTNVLEVLSDNDDVWKWTLYADGTLILEEGTGYYSDTGSRKFDETYSSRVKKVIIGADVDTDPNVSQKLSITKNVENVTVDSENEYYCAVDGVLFSASMETLFYYPPKKSGSTYTTPNGVKTIDVSAFTDCSQLTSIVISDGVETINGLLENNVNLSSISIPTSVKCISSYAFKNCTGLKTVYYAGTEDQWNAITIESYNDPLTSANIIFATVDTDAPTLTTESKTVCPGQSFTVTVSVANNPGIMAMILTPVYDANVMTLDSVDNGTVFSAAPEQGKNLTWLGDVDTDQNGTLLTYHFTVKEDAAEGNYTVGVSSVTSSDEDETPVTFTVTNGTVTVKSIVYGDATGDGEVNIFDLVRLKKYLANYDSDTQTSTIAISGGGDATGNGTIDIFDLVRLKKYLANYDADTKTSTVALGPTE